MLLGLRKGAACFCAASENITKEHVMNLFKYMIQ